MEEILNAVTLKSVDYGESDKMITFFTLERGVISVGAKGVKKNKARLKFSAEPFCFSSIKVSEKSGRLTLVNADCKKSYFSLTSDLSAYLSACLISECTAVLFKNEPNEYAFKSLITAYESLLGGSKKSVAVKFLTDALAVFGYGYDFSGCYNCGEKLAKSVFLSKNAEAFLCSSCAKEGDIKFSFDTYSRLKEVNALPYGDLKDEKTDDNCLKLLSFAYKEKIGLKFNSLDMLLQI